MILVWPTDLNSLGYCHRGARAWFARHGLDWSGFVQNGLPVETFEAIDDAMAARLAAFVREGHGRQE